MMGHEQVDQERSIVLEGGLDGRADLLRFFNAHGGHAHGLGQGCKIDDRIGQVEGVWEGMFANLLVFPILQDVQFEQHVGLVVADDKLGADMMVSGGPQRLDGVQAAAVAGETDHGFVGVGQFERQGAGDAHTQGTAAGLEDNDRAGWAAGSG